LKNKVAEVPRNGAVTSATLLNRCGSGTYLNPGFGGRRFRVVFWGDPGYLFFPDTRFFLRIPPTEFEPIHRDRHFPTPKWGPAGRFPPPEKFRGGGRGGQKKKLSPRFTFCFYCSSAPAGKSYRGGHFRDFSERGGWRGRISPFFTTTRLSPPNVRRGRGLNFLVTVSGTNRFGLPRRAGTHHVSGGGAPGLSEIFFHTAPTPVFPPPPGGGALPGAMGGPGRGPGFLAGKKGGFPLFFSGQLGAPGGGGAGYGQRGRARRFFIVWAGGGKPPTFQIRFERLTGSFWRKKGFFPGETGDGVFTPVLGKRGGGSQWVTEKKKKKKQKPAGQGGGGGQRGGRGGGRGPRGGGPQGRGAPLGPGFNATL